MVARYGSNEAAVTADALGVLLHARGKISKRYLNSIHFDAGLFPYGEETAIKFGQLMERCSQSIDLLGAWDTYMQDYLIDVVCKTDMKISALGSLEPYGFKEPWSSALKGKRVVVVHPFSDTIEQQYQKRENLFSDKNILPEFTLRTVKAVQTIAGVKDCRFRSWFDALDYMYKEVIKEDFDVSIIGCGAYGLPLAARIKESGKIAIHLGGATQILFGIKGKRWDNIPGISKLYNEYWVRPSDNERPKMQMESNRGVTGRHPIRSSGNTIVRTAKPFSVFSLDAASSLHAVMALHPCRISSKPYD